MIKICLGFKKKILLHSHLRRLTSKQYRNRLQTGLNLQIELLTHSWVYSVVMVDSVSAHAFVSSSLHD